jgi:hypothetical protein
MYLLIGLIGAGVVLGVKGVACYGDPFFYGFAYWPKAIGMAILHTLFWPFFLVRLIVNSICENAY